MTSPFKTPIHVSDREFLCGADAELIAKLESATDEEIAEIVRRVNAYDSLVATLNDAIATEEGNWSGEHDEDDSNTEPAWMESARELVDGHAPDNDELFDVMKKLDKYDHFALTHTECTEEYAELKVQAQQLLGARA